MYSKQIIKSNVNYLRVYIVHYSTDSQILFDQTPLKIGPTTKDKFDYKIYRLSYNVIDNSVYEGKSCYDYRKHKDSYGDCNYRALKKHIYSSYGCYPPWMEEAGDEQCEMSNPTRNAKFDPNNTVFEDLVSLTGGIMPQSFKHCQKPCYQVKVSRKEVWQVRDWEGDAYVEIHENNEDVLIQKSVYSFDIFSLTVELGSNLGLWLGKVELQYELEKKQFLCL